jgi:hypothetical protein
VAGWGYIIVERTSDRSDGALKRIRMVRAPSRFTTQLGSSVVSIPKNAGEVSYLYNHKLKSGGPGKRFSSFRNKTASFLVLTTRYSLP